MTGIILACLLVGSANVIAQTTTGQTFPSPSEFKKPWFCHDLACPVYVNSSKAGGNNYFETREYAPSVWIATTVSAVNMTRNVSREMFYKLFHYISGKNSLSMKIPMTAPVVTQIDQCQGSNCKSNYTKHFMIPFNLQANPPSPTETGVFIRRLPAMTVDVRSYAGYSSDALEYQNYNTLVQQLQATNTQFNPDSFATAGYEGPYDFIRHNEIWTFEM